MPGWELCLTGPIGFIICGTDFDFFAGGHETRDESEDILIIERLDIEQYTLLRREDELLES